ncbi:hypothetical protein HRJ34_00320 [Rhizorhabdus wittichii]|uniref:Uncharacterized protein n=1 Tax=Rhizorhabdus wittichii TaxID=160791 RepID=A0A975D3J7_9SPHN|nr:hypothetical protein [Rhizorhabdus wittichii]QTH22024.1 hypothetical protein HRJ34_00320 [Rhizorhabdus wittichii]
MSPDEERLAEALAIKRMHGERAAVFVADRIGALALARDRAGVERFMAIAAKLDEISRAAGRA